MRLVQLDTAELVLRGRLIRVQSVSEQLWLDGHVRVHVAQLEPRMEAVSFLLLKHLVALGRPGRSMRHRAPLLCRCLLSLGVPVGCGLRRPRLTLALHFARVRRSACRASGLHTAADSAATGRLIHLLRWIAWIAANLASCKLVLFTGIHLFCCFGRS